MMMKVVGVRVVMAIMVMVLAVVQVTVLLMMMTTGSSSLGPVCNSGGHGINGDSDGVPPGCEGGVGDGGECVVAVSSVVETAVPQTKRTPTPPSRQPSPPTLVIITSVGEPPPSPSAP